MAFFSRENSLAVTSYVVELLNGTPLDTTAETLLKFAGKQDIMGELFKSYDDFLGMLNSASDRKHLEDLRPDELDTDPVYQNAREISHRFGDAISSIFLTPDNPIGELTIRYGVF